MHVCGPARLVVVRAWPAPARLIVVRAWPGPARPVVVRAWPGVTCLLPAVGFTILRLVHIPSTSASQVTADSESGARKLDNTVVVLTYIFLPY